MKTIVALVLLITACQARAQEKPAAAAPRELTKEEKRAIADAEKQRKDYPDWVLVIESQTQAIPAQTIGAVALCGGDLSWIFCVSQPITAGGGERTRHRVRLESTSEELSIACAKGVGTLLPRRVVLQSAARYPAKRGKVAVLYILANVDGKVRKLSCWRE